MSIGSKGENLVFLISQPRAGSTLLQTILGNHPEIHTLPEPCIALPALYTDYNRKIVKGEYKAEYDVWWAADGIRDFVKNLPNKDEDYFEGMRRMFVYLYGQAMHGTGKRYFLDKGPRYYHILPELQRVFPKAVFIFLMRNPLAVLNSAMSVCNDKKASMGLFKHDLLVAPRKMLEGMKSFGDRCIIIKYEDLLTNPDNEIGRICLELDIKFDPTMAQYKFKEEHKNSFGYCLQPERYKHGRPDVENVDRWAADLEDPQRWRMMNDYLNYLGKGTVEAMGYSFEQLKASLFRKKSPAIRLIMTAPLLRLLKNT
jgi:hypothetical protein